MSFRDIVEKADDIYMRCEEGPGPFHEEAMKFLRAEAERLDWQPVEQEPEEEGWHLVYCGKDGSGNPCFFPSCWNVVSRSWDGLVPYWRKRITHFLPRPTPPEGT